MMPLAVLERDKVIRGLLVAGGAICLLALIFSFSRMSWIAAILGTGAHHAAAPGAVALLRDRRARGGDAS